MTIPADKTHNRLMRDYLDALLSRKRDAAIALVLRAVDAGMPAGEALLSVVQPAQYEVGRLWQDNEITVAEEHYCSATAQLLMSQLYSRFTRRPQQDLSVVAACVDDELHDLGVHVVADFFEMSGWKTYYIGANTPAQTIREAARDLRADVAAISATMPYHVDTVRETVRLLRADEQGPASGPASRVLVGGYAFNTAPGLWERTGADAYGEDARAAVALAEQLVGTGEHGGRNG